MNKDVYTQPTQTHGTGVFASRNFKCGETVLGASGRLMTEQTMYSIQVGWELHLTVPAPVMYLNHSCEPNLGVKQCGPGWVEFTALRDIQKGEEVTFDYAMTEYMHYPRANPDDDFDLTCCCGSTKCRGRLGYYSELSDELKLKYRGFIAPYLLTSNPDPAQKEGPAVAQRIRNELSAAFLFRK